MIAPADIRWLLYYLDVGAIARAAWRNASEDRDAAVVMDVDTGDMEVYVWAAGSDPDVPPGVLVLAHAPASRITNITRACARGTEVPPSPDVVEETVIRASVEVFGLATARAVEERLAAVLEEAMLWLAVERRKSDR